MEWRNVPYFLYSLNIIHHHRQDLLVFCCSCFLWSCKKKQKTLTRNSQGQKHSHLTQRKIERKREQINLHWLNKRTKHRTQGVTVCERSVAKHLPCGLKLCSRLQQPHPCPNRLFFSEQTITGCLGEMTPTSSQLDNVACIKSIDIWNI